LAADIPAQVRTFLAAHIDSVSLLDTLLLVRAVPEKPWTASEVARALVTSDSLAAGQLDHLRRHELLRPTENGLSYAPSAEQAATVDALADCYARRRHTVIGMIYRPANRSASSLADAFRFKRDER
jgi:hypothetical protein